MANTLTLPFLWYAKNPVVSVRINTGGMLVHKSECLLLVHKLNLCLVSLILAHKKIRAFPGAVELFCPAIPEAVMLGRTEKI